MSAATTTDEAIAPEPVDPNRAPRRGRRRMLAGLALALAAVAVAIVVTDPFKGSNPVSGVTDNEYPTSLTTVTQGALIQQTQVSATLGYAGSATIRVPSGTAPSQVTQAQQSAANAQGMLSTARSTLSADEATLAQARATLSADEQLEAVDCAGDNAAQSAGGGCASAEQRVTGDRQAVTAGTAKVTADENQVTSGERSLASAESAVSTAVAHEAAYGQQSVLTALPATGKVIRRGQRLYAVEGQPVLLLYGHVVVTRAFVAGMSPGADVAALNANLDALGYGHGLSGDAFTSGTAAAIRALQSAHGMTSTGQLLLGSVAFSSGAVRVTAVAPNAGVGAPVAPGPLLTVSSTARQVAIELDAALQGEVKVGDPVTITLPDNQTTPGRISYVSSVASSSQGGSTTVLVDAVPTDPAATGNLDQAPVNVAITTASVNNALVVPVDALLALASGGYAVEEVNARGAHQLVAVTTGLFDDADGDVQVSGAGLAAGQRIVIPGV
ncbi:MAG TPA: peptidoglycan-binding domain-containing protein [Solirubrobacteraceae bacterium]|jgi:hypothetical protein|nr:peptidoglycan-binding domain-containing protein [Solirubrobacteraceae bacterium]